MKAVHSLLLSACVISGCQSKHPVEIVTDPAIKILDVATEVVANPMDKKAINRAIHREEVEEHQRTLKKNKYYRSSKRLCRVPKYPKIPTKPRWACTPGNIKTHQNMCVLSGVSEFACGEFIEGKIEKSGRALYSGATASAGCTGVSNLINSGTISWDEVIASGLLGGIDNYGEQLMKDGGLFGTLLGGAVRFSAGMGKMQLVRHCQRKIELSCDPTPIHNAIFKMKSEYSMCQRQLAKLNEYY